MNKSLVTNLAALVVVIIGLVSPVASKQLLATGYFALAGAITNWLAVYMLFDRVPFLYGSGVIPARFEQFKCGIHQLIMGQFFTAENVRRFFEEGAAVGGDLDPEPLLEAVDYESIYAGLVQVIKESKFGGMLALAGGDKALEPLKGPILVKMRELIRRLIESERVQAALAQGVKSAMPAESIIAHVDRIVSNRLDELTPQMVKEIVQDMIRTHLGWLVVWGGVFGGLIGLLTSFTL